MQFDAYIDELGLRPEDDAHARENVHDIDSLRKLLDNVQEPRLRAPPDRVPIISPDMPVGWKQNIRQSLNSIGRSKAREVAGWERVVEYRQRVTLALTACTTAAILWLSSLTLRAQQMPSAMMMTYLVVYGLMTFFLASNFYKLMLGTWHMLRGPQGNPWHPMWRACDPDLLHRVAIIFPVYHEDVTRVAAGMAATWESIQTTHPEVADMFDLFMLSDSRRIEYWVVEQAACHQLRQKMPESRIFYRRRGSNVNAKLGNVVDFCRRAGKNYEYMLVMDADSIMDGEAVVSMLRMMEGNPQIGILQSNPKPILRESLFGRMQQFAGRLYGSVFSYSLQGMYMGHASYIGHNALIRMKPFIDHCILPELTGPSPWGGKPLSHDIIESAMMARAGYEVWFLPEISGSYEEIPPDLLGFLGRERRWMQGNLQHLRFIFLNGLRPIHRETFLNGSLGYLSAPLWAVFLFISAFGMVHFLSQGTFQIGSLRMLEVPMLLLSISSMVFLFMPRILAIGVNIRNDRARGFGGKDKLLWSVLLETIFSFFFSPIMMIFISRFLWLFIKRSSIRWGTQQRDDAGLPWKTCIENFGWVSVIGIVGWVSLVAAVHGISSQRAVLVHTMSDGWITPSDILMWFFPILGGFAGSTWIARATSLNFPSLKHKMLFLIPEEREPPSVVVSMQEWHRIFLKSIPDVHKINNVIAYACKDRGFFINHRAETRLRPHASQWLLPKLKNGIKLTEREAIFALDERDCFDFIHFYNINVSIK